MKTNRNQEIKSYGAAERLALEEVRKRRVVARSEGVDEGDVSGEDELEIGTDVDELELKAASPFFERSPILVLNRQRRKATVETRDDELDGDFCPLMEMEIKR